MQLRVPSTTNLQAITMEAFKDLKAHDDINHTLTNGIPEVVENQHLLVPTKESETRCAPELDAGKLGSVVNQSLGLVTSSVFVLAARYMDAANYHSSTDIVEDCLLAALPLEIRQKIFGYVVADTPIVIRGFSCDPRDYGRPLFLKQDSHTPNRDLHRLCPFGGIVNFAIIRTCKQFYYDARFLPFSVNILEMGYVSNAISFLSTFGKGTLATIRALRIECNIVSLSEANHLSCGYRERWETFCNLAVYYLTNLRELHVDLLGWTFQTIAVGYRSVTRSVDWVKVFDPQNFWIKSLLRFRQLPLSVVKIVSKTMQSSVGETEAHEMRKWAVSITAVLLKDKGPEKEGIKAEEV